MNKKTKLALIIGAVAAIVSAVILVIMFWDRILEKFSGRKDDWDDEFLFDDEDMLDFSDEELNDFADLEAE